MNTKFTKGPWVKEEYSFDVTSKDCCLPIAKVTVFNEAKANAHLIAAAPDMYAMLKEVADMQKQYYGYGMDTHIKLAKMAKKMELILTKARGE